MARENHTTTLIVTFLMLAGLLSAIPSASAEGEDSIIWGIGYEWENLNDDIDSLTGFPLDEILGDFSDAASYAGFNLSIVQVTSGSTQLFVEQWDDSTIIQIDDAEGDAHFVSRRMTEVTLRHGVLWDAALLSDWSDENASYDIVISADYESLATLDLSYVEYVTAEMDLVGADLTATANFEIGAGMGTDLLLEGGDEIVDWDVDLSLSAGWELNALQSEWRLDDPYPIYSAMTESAKPGGVEWECESWSGCGDVSGDYSTTSHYSISLTGLPAHEIGLEADAFDLVISDSFPDSGSFADEMEFEWDYYFDGETQSVTVDDDGNTLDVYQMEDFPLPPGMPMMVGYSLWGAVEGTGEQDTMEAAFEAALEDWEETLEESIEGDDTFECDDGQTIPSSWVNDGEEDCDDGSDEGVESDDPSDVFEAKAEEIVEAFSESNFEKTMEAFGDKLENLLDDYEGSIAYEDAVLYSLWSDDEARFVGVQLLVESAAENVRTLVGPTSDEYSDALVSIHVEYYVGALAEAEESVAEDDDTIEELAPVSEHDISEVNEALGIPPDSPDPGSSTTDDEDSEELAPWGGLPGLGVVSALSVVLGAAIATRAIPRRLE